MGNNIIWGLMLVVAGVLMLPSGLKEGKDAMGPEVSQTAYRWSIRFLWVDNYATVKLAAHSIGFPKYRRTSKRSTNLFYLTLNPLLG